MCVCMCVCVCKVWRGWVHCSDSHWCIDGQVGVRQRGKMLVNPLYGVVCSVLLQLLQSLIMMHFKTKPLCPWLPDTHAHTQTHTHARTHAHTHTRSHTHIQSIPVNFFLLFPQIWCFQTDWLLDRHRKSFMFLSFFADPAPENNHLLLTPCPTLLAAASRHHSDWLAGLAARAASYVMEVKQSTASCSASAMAFFCGAN